MARALSALAFVVLALALFLLPEADPARIAALESHRLVKEGRVGEPPPAGSADQRQALGEAILAGPAVSGGADTEPVLRLGGVRLSAPEFESADLMVHGLARRSLVRGLRELAAAQGRSLQVEGELVPAREGVSFLVELRPGVLLLDAAVPGAEPLSTSIPFVPPRRSSLLPPLVAILLAILFRRPVLALFIGVWSATFLMLRGQGEGLLESAARGLPDVFTELFWPQLVNPDRAKIIGFVVAMLAMVGVMTRSGGIRGLMDSISRLASDARRTQIATWLMGLAVFFDDYANCILVGTTMRPLSDRFRIAREKLAYLVDSTAAPVAGISIFSTWIAFEVSTFSAQLPAAGLSAGEGYAVFVETLPYRFYCILALLLAGTIALSGRDFGPMLAAERRARSTGLLVREGGRPMVSGAATSLEPAPGVSARAHRAVLPVLCFVGVTLFEIVRVGWSAMAAAGAGLSWSDLLTIEVVTGLLGEGDSTRAILVGSTSGLALAVAFALAAGLRGEILRAAWVTLRSMGIAVAILYLAWMIGAACDELGTAPYLSELIGDHLPPAVLPAILFLLSALVAFSTGSSWSTMSILLPLVVGLAFTLGEQAASAARVAGETPVLTGHLLMLMSIGAVLEGSIFGDHCSPISDTTVLSSTASASDHIDHVRTQVPYAMLAMAAALLLGYLPCAFFGLPPLTALAAGAAALVGAVLVFGRRSEAGPVRVRAPAS